MSLSNGDAVVFVQGWCKILDGQSVFLILEWLSIFVLLYFVAGPLSG